MDRDEMMVIFKDLARSQGFYGRLVEAIKEADPWDRDNFWDELESHNFQNPVDLILYIEC